MTLSQRTPLLAVLSAVVVVFYDGTSGGFQQLSKSPSKIQMSLVGIFLNGTSFRAYTSPSHANVVADISRSTGMWRNFGSWDGDIDSGNWGVKFEICRKVSMVRSVLSRCVVKVGERWFKDADDVVCRSHLLTSLVAK